jgi:hypothetical protein
MFAYLDFSFFLLHLLEFTFTSVVASWLLLSVLDGAHRCSCSIAWERASISGGSVAYQILKIGIVLAPIILKIEVHQIHLNYYLVTILSDAIRPSVQQDPR